MAQLSQNHPWLLVLSSLALSMIIRHNIHNSKNAWSTIKKLNSEETKKNRCITAVTPNQIAHQLVIMENQTTGKNTEQIRKKINSLLQNTQPTFPLFTAEELDIAMKTMKTGKTAGLDDINTEQIKHFGPRARQLLLRLFNHCLKSKTIPNMCKRAKVVAVFKPYMDPLLPKNCRPISLLCHLFNLFEGLISARISPIVETDLTPDQAGIQSRTIMLWPGPKPDTIY